MALDTFIEKIPEADREAYKAEIANALFITDKDQAAKLLLEHPILKSAKDSYESKAVAAFEKRFLDEKVPGLIEQKYKEKHPDADPKDLAYKALEEKLNSIQRDGTLKERKAVALQKLAEAGLPVSLADLAIDMDETNFGTKLELLASLKAWKEEEVAKALAEKLGNQGPQKTGVTGQQDFSKMSQTEVMAYARKGPAEEKAVTDWLAKKGK